MIKFLILHNCISKETILREHLSKIYELKLKTFNSTTGINWHSIFRSLGGIQWQSLSSNLSSLKRID